MSNTSIPAGSFKAQCLKLMDEVREHRMSFIVTKHGKPVAKLVPVEDAAPALFGFLAGSVTVKGDIVAPIDVAWDADDRPE